ncbi:hypothetical protein IACHDJAJ_00039 [Aeromonas phage vB_AdhS_TS3]|nr:hypothetical protein IACHDJAJ_00039 [Aeromonas phage vB_AdhS_TS3]
MRDIPAVPKQRSKLDKAKELEDYMHSKGLTMYEMQELLGIIQYSNDERAR